MVLTIQLLIGLNLSPMKKFLLNLILSDYEQIRISLSITYRILEEDNKETLKELEKLRGLFI